MLQLLIAGSEERQAFLTGLGRRLVREGHLRSARFVLGALAAYGEPSPTLFYELGQCQASLGRLEEARASLRRGLDLKPNFYLCRRALLDLCRRQYWAPPLADAPSALPGAEPLAEAHATLRGALFPELAHEIPRVDDDNLDRSIAERLRQRLDAGQDGPRSRALLAQLEASEAMLTRLEAALAAAAQASPSARRRAVVVTRGGEEIPVRGLHDADDLIGYHLEVISSDRLSFIPLEAIQALRFGPRAEYLDAVIEGADGGEMEVAVPLGYHGSHQSPRDAIREAEITVLQRLVGGLHVGLGRRSFLGADEATGEIRAISAYEIERIRFDTL